MTEHPPPSESNDAIAPENASHGPGQRIAWVSFALLAFNVAAFLLAESHGSTLETATLLEFGALTRNRLWDGEYWRLLSSAFIHVGWMHLLGNALVGIGPCIQAEGRFGRARFLTLYLVAGLTGSALGIIAQDGVAAGASGALMGIIGANLIAQYLEAPDAPSFWRSPSLKRALVSFAIGSVVLEVAVQGIGHFAHLGGLLAGATWALIALGERTYAKQRAVLAGAALVMLVGVSTFPLPGIHAEAGAAREAWAQIEKGNHRRALEITEPYASGAHLELLVARAIVHCELLEFSACERDVERLAQLAPGYGYDRELLGNAHLEQGRYETALVAFDSALKLGWDSPLLRVNRARASYHLGDHEAAQEDLARSLERDPRYGRALEWRAWINMEEERYEDALPDLQAALKLQETPELWAWLAEVKLHLRQHEGALEAAERAIALDAEDPFTRSIRGAALLGLGRNQEARAALTEALALGEADPAWANRQWAEALLGSIVE